MSICIRNVLLQDAEDIAEIIREVGWFGCCSESTQKAAEQVRRHISLCLADNSHIALAAENEAHEGYISELFISVKVYGRGIGTALLRQTIKEARKRGCSCLSLINSRTHESYRRRFYEQHSWKEHTEIAAFVLPLM